MKTARAGLLSIEVHTSAADDRAARSVAARIERVTERAWRVDDVVRAIDGRGHVVTMSLELGGTSPGDHLAAALELLCPLAPRWAVGAPQQVAGAVEFDATGADRRYGVPGVELVVLRTRTVL